MTIIRNPDHLDVACKAIAADLRVIRLLQQAEADGTRFPRLTPGVRVGGANIAAAISDAEYLEMRAREIVRAREYRARKREAAA